MTTIIGNSETRGRLKIVHGRAEGRLLPGTLANLSEEDEDDIFNLVKNKPLSNGTAIADLLAKRQNEGHIHDGINLTMELVGQIRARFQGESFELLFSTSIASVLNFFCPHII